MCDLLVLVPHPDDAELHAGGLIAAHVRQGATVVIADATRGEGASRGDPDTRAREAAAAAAVLGVSVREQLALPDGGLNANDPAQRERIAALLRKHRPRHLIALHAHARHPDHRALAQLAFDACKTAAMHRLAGQAGAWSGTRLWYCEAELPLPNDPAAPPLLFALHADDWQRKQAAIAAHTSQFAPRTDAPATSITAPGFLDWIDARGRQWGHHIGAPYAEALIPAWSPGLTDLRHIT